MPYFLVIDDDIGVAGTLTRMLELDGHRVVSVNSAEAGLETALGQPPDALLVDMRMPMVSGLEFLRRMRRDVRLREMPIALVTGDHFLPEQTLGEIHALGATVRYKPLTLDDLRALVQALTG